MVCFDDSTRWIALEALFTLGFTPLVASRKWSTRMTTVIDWFIKVLVAVKLAFVVRAILDDVQAGLWPSNIGSQFWLVVILIAFFYSLIKMILSAPFDASIAIVSFFFGMAMIGSAWTSVNETLQALVATMFHVQVSQPVAIFIGLVLLAILVCVVFVIQWKGWIHTIVVTLFVITDFVISSHIAVYNIIWSPAGPFLTTTICCSQPDFNDLSVNVDGNSCPLRFTWYDCAVLGVAVLVFVPLQFYHRDQCSALWLCCRDRAKALTRYQAMRTEPMYGLRLTTFPIEEEDEVDPFDERWMSPPPPNCEVGTSLRRL